MKQTTQIYAVLRDYAIIVFSSDDIEVKINIFGERRGTIIAYIIDSLTEEFRIGDKIYIGFHEWGNENILGEEKKLSIDIPFTELYDEEFVKYNWFEKFLGVDIRKG